MNKIQEIAPDENLSIVAMYGGEGIHFMFVRGRYRAWFNILEFPYVVLTLGEMRVLQDVPFSTRHPDGVIRKGKIFSRFIVQPNHLLQCACNGERPALDRLEIALGVVF